MADSKLLFKPGYGPAAKYSEYTAEQKLVTMYLTSDTNEVMFRGQSYGMDKTAIKSLAFLKNTDAADTALAIATTDAAGNIKKVVIPTTDITNKVDGLMSHADKVNLDALHAALNGVTLSIADPADAGSDKKVFSEKYVKATFATKAELKDAVDAIVEYIGSGAITVTEGTDANAGKKIIALKINANDKVLTQTADGLLTNIKVVKVGTPAAGFASQYAIVGSDGTTPLGVTIDLVKDQFLKETEIINEATQADKDIDSSVVIGDPYIKLTFVTTTTDADVRYVAVKSLMKVYESGHGVSITYDDTKKTYSVALKLDATGESYLTLGADGLKLSGIDAALTTIKALTINGKKIETNPVLNGADIKLDGYAKAAASEDLLATDTVNQALGKIAKIIEDNELVTAKALVEHENAINELSAAITWDIKA